jgi:hypothetical protein
MRSKAVEKVIQNQFRMSETVKNSPSYGPRVLLSCPLCGFSATADPFLVVDKAIESCLKGDSESV